MSNKFVIQFGVRAARIASIMSHPRPAHLFEHTKRFSTKSPASPNTAHLEVERKFNVTPLLLATLQAADTKEKNSPLYTGTTHDHTMGLLIKRKSNVFINDTYYDCLDLLSSKGIWVRKRTELDLGGAVFTLGQASPAKTPVTSTTGWEVKIRLGGDYSNSEFEEITGEAKVKKAVEQYLSWNDLAQSVVLSTLRKTWTAEERFDGKANDSAPAEVCVVVDKVSSVVTSQDTGEEMKFKYMIGELEITRDIELSGEAEADQAKKAEVTAKMSTEVEKWMESHEDLFPTYPTPLGKLTAFYAWREEKMRD